jgi:hypothetical protein
MKDIVMARLCDEQAEKCGEMLAETATADDMGRVEPKSKEEELIDRVLEGNRDCCVSMKQK